MAQDAATSAVSDDAVSSRILTEIRQRLHQAGEPITISGTKLAAALDIPVNAFRSNLKELFDQGLLVKLSSGLAGTRIAAPDATAPEPTTPTVVVVPAAAAPVDRNGAPESTSLRTRILEHLRQTIEAEGGQVTLTTQRIAEAAGCNVAAAAYHVKALSDIGHIVTQRAGRDGTHFRLNQRPTRGTKPAAPRARPAASRTYCPWCGAGVEHPDWKFCHSCGERLAH